MGVSKNVDGTDGPPRGICPAIFRVCLQELEKHYFPKNLACLQKAYLHNHVKNPNKLSIKNTDAQLCKVNGMLMNFPAPQWQMISFVTSSTVW
eukprot:10528458-Ditylum_brightwellii.AAC.1